MSLNVPTPLNETTPLIKTHVLTSQGPDGTPKEEEAEKKKVKKTKKAKGRPDEDLFGNTDDIFSGVPDSVPKKMTKKKKRAAGGEDGAGKHTPQ